MNSRNPTTDESGSSTSASLLKRVKVFEPDAWQRLVTVYAPLVYRWARQAGLQDNDVTDLGQEVFRTVVLRIDSFHKDGPDDSFRAWLWGITRNKLKEMLRQQAASPQAMGGSDANQRFKEIPARPPENSTEKLQLETRSAIFHRALNLVRGDFEEKTWEAFWRLAISKEKAPEIAKDLEMTAKAVRQAKYRVLRRLREEFSELG